MEAIKEILTNIPTNYLSALVFNGSLIVLAYLIFWKKLKQRFQKWRIQLNQRADAKQIKREIKNSFVSLLVAAVFSSIVIYLSTQGYTQIYTDIQEHSIGWSIAGFFILLFLDDTWFYWIHRLLHNPKIYKYVHLEHHKSIDVNPFSSMSFHWIEPFLLSLWIFPAAYLMPIYAPVLGIVQVYGLLDNIKSHLGYEFYPTWLNKSWLRFLTSSTYHNMHHAKFNGNYGVHFRFWDRIMGTEFQHYEQDYDEIKARKTVITK